MTYFPTEAEVGEQLETSYIGKPQILYIDSGGNTYLASLHCLMSLITPSMVCLCCIIVALMLKFACA
jgi:hypothetical protein